MSEPENTPNLTTPFHFHKLLKGKAEVHVPFDGDALQLGIHGGEYIKATKEILQITVTLGRNAIECTRKSGGPFTVEDSDSERKVYHRPLLAAPVTSLRLVQQDEQTWRVEASDNEGPVTVEQDSAFGILFDIVSMYGAIAQEREARLKLEQEQDQPH